MKTILFPHRFKRASGIAFYFLLIVGGILYFSENQFDHLLVIKVPNLFGINPAFATTSGFWMENGYLDELFTVMIIVTGIVNSFAKEKREDEMISKLRFESLGWSLYINYGLIILATLIIFDFMYFQVMVVHLFAILLFFNLRFKFRLYQFYSSNK